MASDPFPLVLPSNFFEETSRERPAGRRAARRRAKRDWTRRATEDIFSSLNALASARASHTPQPGRVRQTSTLTPSQESVLDRVVRSVARHGQPPADFRPREAFQELLKSSNIYSEEGRLTVRPFDQDKVPLLLGSVEPREALDLVLDPVRQVLMEPSWFLERHSDELADEPHVEPHWDPLLNPRFHRLPPQTSMASVEALAAVQVGTDWRQRCTVSSDEAALYAATVDLKDGFHQFKIPHLSERFVFDMPGVHAMDFGVQQVYDGDVGSFVSVAPEDYVWPAYGGLAMGWSWALWICHETLAHVMKTSAGPSDATVLDKVPAARLRPGMVGDFPYVDNANVIGLEREVAQARIDRVTKALDLLGLKWHEKQGAGVEVEIPGVIVDGVQGLVRPKPKRLWRLCSGMTFLLKWGKAAGWQVRAVLGHLVSFFQLLRPGLSVFRVLYDFVQEDLGEVRELPTAALQELRIAQSILFMAAGRWGLPACPVAFVTDASMKSYALLETDISADEVHDLSRFRGRARFSRREKFVEREHDGFRGSLAIGDAGGVWWDGLLERARPRGPVPERSRVEVDSGWRPPPLPDDFVDPKRWGLVVAGAWRDASRIRDNEARCGLMGLARAASYAPYHDAELLSAGDNLGSVLAFEKGRAANRELLAQCRRAAALQLATSIVRRQRHVEGARNAADYMSRAADRGLLQPGQGYMTGAVLEAGLRVGIPMDLQKGSHFDTTDPKVQKVIIRWIRSGAVWLMRLATPCTRWSVARSSGTAEPAGGSAAARFTVRQIQECRRAGVHFTLENPQRSRLWTRRPLARALRSAGATLVDLCQRRFGTPFQNPTRFAAPHPLFTTLHRECKCRRHCEVLQGKVFVRGRWEWKTSLAAAYPPGLCRAYAGVAQHLAPAAAARPDGEAELERRRERQLAVPAALARGAGTRAGRRGGQARAEPLEHAPGFLRRSTARSATAARNSSCVQELDQFVGDNGGSLSDPHAADATLERSFESLLLGGEAKANARCCLHGLARQRGWATKGGALPRAKQPIPSKTNTFDDTVFLGSVAKGQAFVGDILSILMSRAGQDKFFGGLTLARLEAVAKTTCRRLQLPVTFTPHCLRHGGASRDALEKFEDLRSNQRRGRWKARESVRRHEKAGTLLRVRSKFAVFPGA
ncbi:unnamed protein product [Prorocentrum cordatum]|uniref:RNA-directed RNA polymerase n=1 Tax=Prorocentrum cordatum TaxID=2364126 RepID=A0ABN9TBN7_9DINO|nr:unnamed protein product [Polarella glacialis]